MGNYTLTERLGEGGQGSVYLATAPDGSRVAVKLLRADLAGDEEASVRFVREVALARRVAPFCTAQVIETGLSDGRPYIVSEYIDGPNLADVVRAEGPRTGASLHRLAIGTVTALVAIHQAGIVHRDFKPSNVVLASDGPRVIDFGIARALDLTSTLTDAAIGTPSFMAPEQLTDSSPGPQSDMFAWACTLLYAASGQPPFGQDSLPAVVNRIMHTEPDLGVVDDPALRSLMADCLAKDPSRRPSAGGALMRLLGQSRPPGPVAGPPLSPPLSPPLGPAPGLLQQGTAMAAPGAHGPGPGLQAPPPPVPIPSGPVSSGPVSGPSYAGGGQRPPHLPPPTRPQPFYQPPPVRPASGKATGWIIAVAVVGAIVLVAAGGFVAVRLAALSGSTTASPSPLPSTSSARPSVSASAPPAARRAIALPGTSVRIQERADDPLKLASYSVDGGKRVYVRKPGTDDFALNTRYYEYALNADGTRALATDVNYTSDHYAQVSVVDHRTGARRTIKLSLAPVYPTTPRWSPDGRLGLVTLYRAEGSTSVEYGYGIIDVEQGTGQTFQVKEKGAGVWRFFWDADGRSVGTWAGGAMTFYDLNGRVVRTLPRVGSPVWVEGDDVSPSGNRFLAYCTSAGASVCARSTSGGDAVPVTIPVISKRLIGWWDDEHLAVWRSGAGGYEAVVVDLRGQAGPVVAIASKPAEFDKMGFRYTRGTP
ncbi:protein kinase [Nonomuraea sp. NPDC000554]|uniref:serine/threonine-protein kinase n=1 Tax=Nonomuraea sp. NPDC000554 TaxID=3154259 RepID=UPI00331DC017